jgi:holo-[acyl-carrier protein] synthase
VTDRPPPGPGALATWLSDPLPWLTAAADHATPGVRVGIDLVMVDDVARSLEAFGDRFLERVFTRHEVDCCRRPDGENGPVGYSLPSLAARMAAKEATLKVLRPVGPRPPWREIEIRRTGAGWCEVALTGRASSLAVEGGLEQLAVSLTHEATVAAAVVVGMYRGADQGGPAPSAGQRYGERGVRDAGNRAGDSNAGNEVRK